MTHEADLLLPYASVATLDTKLDTAYVRLMY